MACCRSIWRVRSRNESLNRSQSMNATNETREDSTQLSIQESRAMTNTAMTNTAMTNTAMTNTMDHIEAAISPEAFAQLGDGTVAYVKTIRSEDVPALFPQAPQIAPGMKLFALHAADGTPIMLTDSREAAEANAWSQELEMVSVH